jgi:hypothetical protein
VEAGTGAIVRSLNLLKTTGPDCVPCSPVTQFNCGKVFFHDPVVFLDDPSLRDADNVDAALMPCRLDFLTSPVNLDGTFANTSITTPRAGPPYDYLRSTNERAVDEIVSYFHATRAKQYLSSMGFLSVMNYSIGIDAHDAGVGDNAYYSPSQRAMHLGEGGIDAAQDPDVVYHEYGHAIHDNQIFFFGTTHEGGSLGEGFGDYWAASLLDDQEATLLGTACLGSWDSTWYNPYDGSPGSGCLRRLDNSWQYPRDMRYEVHDDGEIWSAALWDLRGILGPAIADRLVIKSHTFMAMDARFIDNADALLSADQALYGGTHAGTINGVLRSRGIPRTGTPASSAGDTDFEIYEGTIGDFAGHAPRLCSTGGATTATLTPASGSSYYLVVPRRASVEGSYGLRSDGTQRPAGAGACLPREIAAICQ